MRLFYLELDKFSIRQMVDKLLYSEKFASFYVRIATALELFSTDTL